MKNILLILFVLASLLLTACGSNNSDSTPQAIGTLESVPAEYADKTNPLGADASTDDGAKIFKTNCETCHGTLGHGDGPIGEALDPKPKNLAELQVVASDDYLFWRISEGKPGTSMPPWKNILNEEQIWQIVAFIRTLK
jgi:mono/diheme cytochrome c family protein